MKVWLIMLLALCLTFLLGAIMSGVEIDFKTKKFSLKKPEFGFGAVIIISTFVISNNIAVRRGNIEGFTQGYKEGLTDGGKIVQEKMIKALDDEIDKAQKRNDTISYY